MLDPSTSSDVLRGLTRMNQDPAATLLLAYKLFLESIHDHCMGTSTECSAD
jgi:ABC-type antimicrobial peptide transport system ATPase subunit